MDLHDQPTAATGDFLKNLALVFGSACRVWMRPAGRPRPPAGAGAASRRPCRTPAGAKPLFEDAQNIKTDPEMVKLAIQFIDRQTSRYDPSDVEDRYETRLRAMIDAKLKGEGLDAEPDEPEERSNVVDLMAALKKSLGQSAPADKPAAPEKPPTAPKEPKKRCGIL